MFQRAQRKKAKLRLALCGPSGGGKTYTSLLMAQGLGGPIAMIDTEQGSGELYADLTDYDVARLTPPFSPGKYIQAIQAAEQAGYNVLIIDSLSHAWAGQGGILEEVDKRKAGQKNQFAAWRDVTPQHNSLVDAILQSGCHIIVTMRTKTAYDFEKDANGRLKPVKVGLAPVQRDGVEYEFTVVLDIEAEKHVATSSKDRTGLFDGHFFVPTVETGKQLKAWLEQGVDAPQAQPQAAAPQQFSRPPQEQQTPPSLASKAQLQKINTLIQELGITDRQTKLDRLNKWLASRGGNRQVSSSAELTQAEASALIETLQAQVPKTGAQERENLNPQGPVQDAISAMDEPNL